MKLSHDSFNDSNTLGLTFDVLKLLINVSVKRGLRIGFIASVVLFVIEIILFERLGSSGAQFDDDAPLDEPGYSEAAVEISEMLSDKSMCTEFIEFIWLWGKLLKLEWECESIECVYDDILPPP